MFYEIRPLITEEFREELHHLPAPLRESRIFALTLEQMPLQLLKEDLFAGRYGYDRAPEMERPKAFDRVPVMTQEQLRIHRHLNRQLNTVVGFSPAHTCIDYETVLKKGLIHYRRQVDGALAQIPGDIYLQAMAQSLDAAMDFSLRYARMAREMEKSAENEADAARFARMAAALEKVPKFGAENFYEAVQSLWLVHSMIPMAESSWASISLGRMDKYLYPYYRQADPEEAACLLRQLFRMLDTYGDGACAMNIGGMDERGNDQFNELSLLLIRIEKELCLRAPIFAVRVHEKMSEEVLDSLMDHKLFSVGQPTFYSEENCREAVARRGIPEADAADFAANSCMGLILPGREFANMWALKFNTHLALELAINHGRPLHAPLELALTTQPMEITSGQDLLAQTGRYLTELIGLCARQYRAVAMERAANFPDPFLSAMTEGCIENRADRAVAATYDTVTLEFMGLVNTCDAICAIDTLVFEKKQYTLTQLMEAARADFEGCAELQAQLRRCAKWGSSEKTNAVSAALGSVIAAAAREYSYENFLLLPSLHTLDVNVGYGKNLPATLDGRNAGAPVSKNANPSVLAGKVEPTEHVLAAASLPQKDFSGGQPIDLYFPKAWFETRESRDKLKQLIRSYFRLGGLQVQVNSADITLLEKAHAEPDHYPQVIVRKGGYSVRFNEMSPDAREDFIRNAWREEGGQ